MKPDYFLCDICGEKTKETLWICVDRQCDAAGSMDDVGENKDLCPRCLKIALQFMLMDPVNRRASNHEAGKRLLEWIKAKGKA